MARGQTEERGATRADSRGDGSPAPRDAANRQREEFGGLNWGSAFFGWLVAIGVASLLTAILSAAGAAIGLTSTSPSQAGSQAQSQAGTVGIVGGIVLLIVLMLAYYAGGYVAGRMSRFDGPRQGLGVWLVGLIITVILAVAGVVLGSQYNVLAQLNLPRIPVDEGSLATGGIIALVAIVVGTILAAMAGGKQGTHYHRKIDRTGGVEA